MHAALASEVPGQQEGEAPCCLPPEIEAAHAAACAACASTYQDPNTGYTVFTAHFLRDKQGWCCGNRCRWLT